MPMTSRFPRSTALRLLAPVLGLALLPTAATAAASDAALSRARHHAPYLRVASWNISGVLNDGKGAKHRPWQDRRSVVARQLLGQAPVGQRGRPADVIALQEANTSKTLAHGRTQYTDLVHALNVRATGADHYRAVRPRLASNATRIAYNARTLRLLRAGALRWRAQEMRVDGARMMAWATFRQVTTGKRFFFASVHLETASKDVRWAQWRQLIRVVPKLAHGLPVVLGGDFNVTRNMRHESARRLLPKMRKAGFGDTLGQYGAGYLTYQQARPKHVVRAQFNSVNKYARRLGHYKRHSWVGQDTDYVFASNRLSVRRWGLVADLPSGSDRLRGTIPSDHNLVRVTIALRR